MPVAPSGSGSARCTTAAAEWALAEERFRAALDATTELAEQAGEPRALGQAHNLLGVLEGSLAHLSQSLALAEDVGDAEGRVAALNNLALAHRQHGDLPRALELTRAALALCIEIGDRHREAALRNNLADLLHATGRSADAMEELKPSVTIFAEIGAEGPHPAVWKLARW